MNDTEKEEDFRNVELMQEKNTDQEDSNSQGGDESRGDDSNDEEDSVIDTSNLSAQQGYFKIFLFLIIAQLMLINYKLFFF